MNLVPLVLSWAVLASIVVGLAFYRKIVARQEDDYLRMDTQATAQQQVVTKKLEVIDKWGKLLTIIAAVFALILFGVFLYNGWIGSASIPQ